MRDTFLADAQSALLALLFGDAVQADDELVNLTGDEYGALYQTTQRLSRWRSHGSARPQTSPTSSPYDDLSSGGGDLD